MLPTRHLPILAVTTLLVASPCKSARGADVVILLDPKCLLDAKAVGVDDGKFKDKKHYSPLIEAGGSASVVEGGTVKGVQVKGEAYIVELMPTKATPGLGTTSVTLGPGRPTPVSYKTVALRQPYKVWHVAGEGQQPALLAEFVVSGLGSELKHLGNNKVEISKLTNAELTEIGMKELHDKDLAPHISAAFAGRIIAGRPDGTSATGHPTFPLTKVSNKNGDVTIEIELHNRLPVAVVGSIGHLGEFELEAGEKKTLKSTNKFDPLNTYGPNTRVAMGELKLLPMKK